MELLSKPIRLNPDMALILDIIKKSGEPYPVYQWPAGEADEKILDVANQPEGQGSTGFARGGMLRPPAGRRA